jgi:hypothetical protein
MVNRNIVCSILFKDKNKILRRIFDIEGDKSTDPSIYIVKVNHINNEVQKSEEERRKFYLQHSHHSRQDSSGLVQVHYKRNGNRFGQRKQLHLEAEGASMKHYHFASNDDLQRYPQKIAGQDDIVLNVNPEYFSEYGYVFFTEEDRLKKYASQNQLTILHSYKIPVKNIKTFNLALVMKLEKLAEIQKQSTS